MTDEKDMAKQLKYRAGDVVTLKVARLGEMGAFLDAGTGDTSDDILLHKLQQTEAVNVGDEVKVYLYKDPHGRLTASQKLPKMREGQIGYVKVLSVTKDGGFVDIGAERGVFLPYSEMRGHVSPGQLVWIKLYRDKTKICIICKNVKARLSDKTNKIFSEKQTKTDQDKHNSTNTKIHQILHQDISCIFCSGKTSLNHCKTSLHPEYERSTN